VNEGDEWFGILLSNFLLLLVVARILRAPQMALLSSDRG
jgi:hypothetical protein